MDEIGPAGWVAIGVAGMALAGAAHAVVGAGRIVSEMLRTPTAVGGSEARPVSGPGGWILVSAVVLAGGAAAHVAVGAGAIVREVLHTATR